MNIFNIIWNSVNSLLFLFLAYVIIFSAKEDNIAISLMDNRIQQIEQKIEDSCNKDTIIINNCVTFSPIIKNAPIIKTE